MNICKKLNEWESAKLITEAQKGAIQNYENNKCKSHFFQIMLFLAAFCIGLGIISLIAANWQEIPGSFKISIDILLLAGVSSALFYSSTQNRPILMETLIVAYALLIIGSIGLIAQVYQIQSNDYKSLLIWSAITIPLLALSKKSVLPMIWVPVFIFAVLDQLQHFEWFYKLFTFFENAFPYGASIFGLLLWAGVYRGLKSIPSLKSSKIIISLKFWFVVAIALQIIFLDFFGISFSGRGYLDIFRNNSYSANIWAASGMIIGIMLLSWFDYRYNNKSHLAGDILASMLLFSLVYPYLPLNETIFQIWGLLLTLTSLGWLMIYAHQKQNIKLLNVTSALIGLRIFVVYLQIFGSLLTTGLGLVSSGILLLLVILIWNKFKTKNAL